MSLVLLGLALYGHFAHAQTGKRKTYIQLMAHLPIIEYRRHTYCTLDLGGC